MKLNNLIWFLPLVVRLMRVAMSSSRRLRLYATNHSTLQVTDYTQLAQITISNSSQDQTSSNNLLAYRPRFSDGHNSNLAGVFINLEGVFPCLAPLTNYYPICRVFTDEEDGFRDGRALIDSGDIGNNLQVFSSSTSILTYGIAIQQCPEFNTACFPAYHSFTVACYLPRSACSWVTIFVYWLALTGKKTLLENPYRMWWFSKQIVTTWFCCYCHIVIRSAWEQLLEELMEATYKWVQWSTSAS